MIGETVTIVRRVPDGEDAMGNPAFAATEFTVDGCAFAPGGSAESTATFGGRTDSDGTVYAPEGTVVLGTDMLRIRGVLYTVDGDAQEWVNPYTLRGAGVVVSVKRGS